MSENTVTTSKITAKLLDLLVERGLIADHGQQPEESGWSGSPGVSMFVGYAILWSLPGTTDGSIADTSEDGNHVYQVTSVGSTPAQAEQIADIARTTLVGQRFDVGGRKVTLITCDTMTGVVPDDTVKPRVFMCADRFGVMSTPESEVGS